MANITPPQIIQNGKTWHISGEVLMDNANVILLKSESLSMSDGFVVDFSDVTKVDTAALSLMLEWQRRAFTASSKVSFVHLPINLSRLAVLYGVAEFIPLSTS